MHTADAWSTLQEQALLRWRQALVALRPSGWPAAIAALLALGMLLAFQQVVARSVAQGELRRQARAAQIEGIWRCKLLRDAGARDHCLAQWGVERHPASPRGRAARVLKPMEQ